MAYYVAVGFGAYALTSLTLFCFPNILHKKKKYRSEILEEALHSPTHKPLLIGHRGGAREGLENTLPTFKHTVAQGGHMLEFDLQMTKDGVVIVAHDENLIRVCNRTEHISELNYDELPPFSTEIPIHFSEDNFQNNNPNAKFSKLEEVFQALPFTLMHIDLKAASPELIKETVRIVKKYERQDITILGSVNGKKTDEIRKQLPNVLTFCSAGSYILVFLAYMVGLLPFFPLSFNFFSVAKYTVDFDIMSKSKKKPLPRAFKILAGLLKFFDFISKPLFRHLQKRGVLVTWWVLNHPKDYKEALGKQVNGIMTDVPSALRSYLDENNKYMSIPIEKSKP